MAVLMFVAVVLTPLVHETKDLVLPETVVAQEETANGEAVTALHQKSMPSDSSSNSEDSPRNDAYHIDTRGVNGSHARNGLPEKDLQMHLLQDQDGKGVGENGVVKNGMDSEYRPNNIPV